ncbi:hypothetical protein [Kiloniella litopenaei]|uniref:hypothetical protein n=1 Tax=Kiloniella litopenaei TaxID=1549748 RepID=UPI003BAA75D0
MPGKPHFKGKPLASLTGVLSYRLPSLPVGFGPIQSRQVRSHQLMHSFCKSSVTLSSGLRHTLILSVMACLGTSSGKTVNEIWA